MDRTPTPPLPPSPREEFAAELTRLREKADLTVRAVAARVDAPGAHTTVGGWFAGQNLPSIGSLPCSGRCCTSAGCANRPRSSAGSRRWPNCGAPACRAPCTQPCPTGGWPDSRSGTPSGSSAVTGCATPWWHNSWRTARAWPGAPPSPCPGCWSAPPAPASPRCCGPECCPYCAPRTGSYPACSRPAGIRSPHWPRPSTRSPAHRRRPRPRRRPGPLTPRPMTPTPPEPPTPPVPPTRSPSPPGYGASPHGSPYGSWWPSTSSRRSSPSAGTPPNASGSCAAWPHCPRRTYGSRALCARTSTRTPSANPSSPPRSSTGRPSSARSPRRRPAPWSPDPPSRPGSPWTRASSTCSSSTCGTRAPEHCPCCRTHCCPPGSAAGARS